MPVFWKKKKDFYLEEKKDSFRRRNEFEKYPVPDFDLGLEYLGIENSHSREGLALNVDRYAKDWFNDLEKFFKIEEDILVRERDGFLEFPSTIDKSQTAKFKCDLQKKGTPGSKVAVIHIMHWDGRLRDYKIIIDLIRNTGLPISSLIYVPAGRGFNPGRDCGADFESVSPNVGKTVFKSLQYIKDIQAIARYLKEKKGFEQVGVFTYSIGSMYGAIASLTSPGLFDFGIYHMVADDFSEAVFEGISTQHVAQKIRKKIDEETLKKIWSVISPGAYTDYFFNLPKRTRIVQSEYDYIFGIKNVERFSEKIKRYRPDIELETVPVNHIGIGKLPISLKIMKDNLAFIYENTRMGECKRSVFFKRKKARQAMPDGGRIKEAAVETIKDDL